MSRRLFVLANLATLLAAIFLSIGFGAGLSETSLHMTRYFSNPPASFATWYGDMRYAIRFWAPLQTGGLLLLIAAFVLNWRSPVRRRLLGAGLAVYLGLAIWTAVYFAPEIRWLLVAAKGASVPVDFVVRAHRWYLLTWVRQTLGAVPFLTSLLALAVPFGAKGKTECLRSPDTLDAVARCQQQ